MNEIYQGTTLIRMNSWQLFSGVLTSCLKYLLHLFIMTNRQLNKLRKHLLIFPIGGNKDINGKCTQTLFFGRRDRSAHLYRLLQLDEQSELFNQDLIMLTGGDNYYQEVKHFILRQEFKLVDTTYNKHFYKRCQLYALLQHQKMSLFLWERHCLGAGTKVCQIHPF